MATLSWDPDSGAGPPYSFRAMEVGPVVRSPKESGIVQTRERWTKKNWLIEVTYPPLDGPKYAYLVEFFTTHGGSVPFDVQWPDAVAMAGTPGGAGGGVFTTMPWVTDTEVGAGQGMIFSCRLVVGDDGYLLAAEYSTDLQMWVITSPLIFERV